MSDDLIDRLRDERLGHAMFLRLDAAAALEEARAELERLRRYSTGDWASQRENDALTIEKHEWKDRATAAKSELSTLRARVREVVGPFAAIEATGWTGSYLAEPAHDGSDVSILYHAASNTTVNRGHFRAAKLLMEELK